MHIIQHTDIDIHEHSVVLLSLASQYKTKRDLTCHHKPL